MKSYIRFLSRNKFYAAIQFIGLSVSLAFVLLISCYVWQNLRVLSLYPDTERIYSVSSFMSRRLSSGLLWGEIIKDNIPEVEDNCFAAIRQIPVKMEDGSTIGQDGSFFVSDSFWDFFKTDFVYGGPEVLKDKSNVAVTEEFANIYGGRDIIGKKIISGENTFTIAAIVRGMESSIFALPGPVIMSAANLNINSDRDRSLSYSQSGILTFIKLREGVTVDEVHEKLDALHDHLFPNARQYRSIDQKHYYNLCPFDELFFSDINDESEYDGLKKGQAGPIISFSIIVLFLLISAIFNYINLSTALAGKRSREMATRMLLGDDKRNVFLRVTGESVAFVMVSMLAAYLIASLSIDGINGLLNSPIPLKLSLSQGFLFIYLAVFLLTSVLCGVIPAAMSSNFKPIEIVKGEYRFKSKRVFSKVFIVIQNSLALVMIALSMVVNSQIHHMIEMPLNSNIDNIFMISKSGSNSKLRKDIASLPYVKRIGESAGHPGSAGMRMGTKLKSDEDMVYFNIMSCDTTAFSMYDFKILHRVNTSGLSGLWLTESTFNTLGMDYDNPVLREDVRGMWGNRDFAGVIKDIPLNSALELDPNSLCILEVGKGGYGASLLIETEERTAAMEKELYALTESEVKRQSGDNSFFRAMYLEDIMLQAYDNVRKQSSLVNIFMLIAIMLSVLGQLAMSSYYASENQRETGIRKVFGGSIVSEIIRPMKSYMLLCLISIAIAVPLSVYLAEVYLEGFIYKMELKPWLFIAAAASTLLISFCSVFSQLLRSARTNPAEVLKKE